MRERAARTPITRVHADDGTRAGLPEERRVYTGTELDRSAIEPHATRDGALRQRHRQTAVRAVVGGAEQTALGGGGQKPDERGLRREVHSDGARFKLL